MLSDEELMSAWTAGDDGAFRELFERYTPFLLRVMARGLARPEDATDLVQQTFLQLHRARYDFKQGTTLRPWLIAIASNVRRMHRRAGGRRPEDPVAPADLPEIPVAPQDPEQRERAVQVRRALGDLPDDQREVVWLHWFEGLSFPEIATVVGARHGTVKVRAHRAYERLRGMLGSAAP